MTTPRFQDARYSDKKQRKEGAVLAKEKNDYSIEDCGKAGKIVAKFGMWSRANDQSENGYDKSHARIPCINQISSD